MIKIIYDLSEDTRIREAARIREKALHDEASALANAKNEGRAEGRAEGRVEGRAEGEARKEAFLVANMRALGLSEEQINAIRFGQIQ